ncbi:hypothetical protein YC2023_055523 [Brassica napus]
MVVDLPLVFSQARQWFFLLWVAMEHTKASGYLILPTTPIPPTTTGLVRDYSYLHLTVHFT